MHYADINAALTKAGWPPSKVAKHFNAQSSAVSQVTRGQVSSYKIASFIATKTGIAITRLWPGRYDHRIGLTRKPERRKRA